MNVAAETLQKPAGLDAWRREERATLLACRQGLSRPDRRVVQAAVVDRILDQLAMLPPLCIGFYWPIKGEIDLREVGRRWVEGGGTAALPAVVEKAAPVEFWDWGPGTRLARGFWNIPVPATRDVVTPQVLLVPLLGFDEAGYRLGYGGGYYDRTLAALSPRPLTIGVGYRLGRLPTIRPQPYDIPMDAIVTEAASVWHRWCGAPVASLSDPADGEAATQSDYASPPCFLHELDPGYLGYMDREETVDLLNRLLEGERAGARAAAAFSRRMTAAEPGLATLRAMALDGARHCAMLAGHIGRLGSRPSDRVGALNQNPLTGGGPAERLGLLVRGQSWAVRKLEQAIPVTHDEGLRRDLQAMLDRHAGHIRSCSELIPDPAGTEFRHDCVE